MIRLLVILIVDKSELDGRNREHGMEGAAAACDRVGETPLPGMLVMEFKNNSIGDFEVSYYVLTDSLRSKVTPYRRRFFSHLFPRTCPHGACHEVECEAWYETASLREPCLIQTLTTKYAAPG